MISAREAMKMATEVTLNRINNAQEIAHKTIDAIEALVTCAAGEGKDRIVFYLYNYHNFNTNTEKQAYRNTLKEILESYGYHVTYNTTGAFLEIRFF